MGYHLFHCGSKTTQCSKCLKYIHRANYDCNVDNQCIDFDEEEEEESIPCEVCNQQIKFSSYDHHLV
jgi:hypothetical protein